MKAVVQRAVAARPSVDHADLDAPRCRRARAPTPARGAAPCSRSASPSSAASDHERTPTDASLRETRPSPPSSPASPPSPPCCPPPRRRPSAAASSAWPSSRIPVGFDTLGKKKAAVYTQLALAYTHNRLLKYDPSGEVVNDLAERWTQPNPTTYVVTLRKGVRFHNKPPSTAGS